MEVSDVTDELEIYNVGVSVKGRKALTRYFTNELSGLFTIIFDKMDAWFEEDEQIFVHPKDPYKVRSINLLSM